MYLKSYYKSCKRGDFEWKPITIEDNNVLYECAHYEDRHAYVYIVENGKFEIYVVRKHVPFEVSYIRASRNTARKLAEKLILKDIEKSNTLAICDMELLTK